jgi:hypothetical protein
MIDKKTLRSQLDVMEQTAEGILRENYAFREALEALKKEIDCNSQVKSVVDQLLMAGHRVSNCFAPRVRINIRPDHDTPDAFKVAETTPASDPVVRLTDELTEAASLVIQNSSHCETLEELVNEAVSASGPFDEIASALETSGQQLVICLDLAVFAQLLDSARKPVASAPSKERTVVTGETLLQLTAADLNFLKELNIAME